MSPIWTYNVYHILLEEQEIERKWEQADPNELH